MRLTDKARDAFAGWMMANHSKHIKLPGGVFATDLPDIFLNLPEVLQNALIMDFMDEQWIIIGVLYEPRGFKAYVSDRNSELLASINRIADRNTITNAAIEKANEILNERLG